MHKKILGCGSKPGRQPVKLKRFLLVQGMSTYHGFGGCALDPHLVLSLDFTMHSGAHATSTLKDILPTSATSRRPTEYSSCWSSTPQSPDPNLLGRQVEQTKHAAWSPPRARRSGFPSWSPPAMAAAKELMQKGYGIGSGISLFIATNICESGPVGENHEPDRSVACSALKPMVFWKM